MLFLFRPNNQQQDRLTNLKIIDEMLRVYDRRATPTNKIGTPTRVVCELFIRSFGSISEKTMVSTYLLQCRVELKPKITELEFGIFRTFLSLLYIEPYKPPK